MNKILIFIIISAVSITLNAQSKSTHCKGKGYKGYIFDTSYLVLKSIARQQGKAMINCDEVNTAEAILKNELQKFNVSKVNQGEGCPIIDKMLCKYHRQYFGFLNDEGDKIIWINLFWNKSFNKQSSYDLISANDGCSYYWNIEVNLTKRTLSNLKVNGKG